MRTERETIANHEAGHAAVAWLCGFNTSFVNIHQTEDRKGGVKLDLTETQIAAVRAGDVDMVRRRIFVCCAGVAADYRHARTFNYSGDLEGFNSDRDTAESLMAHIGESGSDYFIKYALFVFNLLEHFGWDVVEEVARILLDRDELTSGEIAKLRGTKGTLQPDATAMAEQALK